MAKDTAIGGNRRVAPWRIIGWGTAALLLLLPLIAMRFTEQVQWTGADFVFAGMLFGTLGLGIEFAVRRSPSRAYRGGAVLALIAAFLTVWVNAAVGMIGAGDNSYNFLFGLVVVAAMAGAVATRGKAAGMALAMAVAGLAHAAVALGGFGADPRGALFSLAFAGPWLLAAAAFRAAARAA